MGEKRGECLQTYHACTVSTAAPGLQRSCGCLRGHGGQLFYYADEKAVGTPKQTRLDPAAPEMRRILEPSMHVDSVLSANIQFADWVAACVTRGVDYQLVRTSRHRWIAETDLLPNIHNAFTYESKLHLHERSLEDIVRSQLFRPWRPLHPRPGGQLIGESVDPDLARKMKGIAEAARYASNSGGGTD